MPLVASAHGRTGQFGALQNGGRVPISFAAPDLQATEKRRRPQARLCTCNRRPQSV